MVTHPILQSAQIFLYNNARLLERRVFEYLFLNREQTPALAALRAYQNPDGGFGNALEPDKRTPNSQPVDQEFALRTLDSLGFDTLVAGEVCNFLETITTPQGGVPFVLPTVRDAPRAPWWNTEDDPPASINPTASIAALLQKNDFRHSWLIGATRYCWEQIEALEQGEVHDVLCAVRFLENAPDRARSERTFEKIAQQILDQRLAALDVEAVGYVHKPLEWAPTPTSMCRRIFSDKIISAHLDALVAKQQSDGGWPISWTAVSPACEMEYRGVVTLEALKILKAYGRLE